MTGRADTSREAFDSILPDIESMRMKIFKEIAFEPAGWTCDELEVHMGMRHQTVSPRLLELVEAGRIEDSGERRPTRSGRGARVYVLSDQEFARRLQIRKKRAGK